MGDFGFKFSKRRQLIVGSHNEKLSVAAMRVSTQIVRPPSRTQIAPDWFFDCRRVNERRLFYRPIPASSHGTADSPL